MDRKTSLPRGTTFPVRRETVRQCAARTATPSSFALNTSPLAHLHNASTVYGNCSSQTDHCTVAENDKGSLPDLWEHNAKQKLCDMNKFRTV